MRSRALFTAALITALALTGCGSKSSGSSSVSEKEVTTGTSEEPTAEPYTGEIKVTSPSDVGLDTSQAIFERDYADVPDVDEGPVLKISDTTAKAGENAKVTISVYNAEGKWDTCGLHIVFPTELECVMNEDAENEPEYEEGLAIKKAQATVARMWNKNFPEDLQNQNKGSVFFTAICPENLGKDGDIVTFFFKVPENAAPGKVYDINFYYSSNEYTKDLFTGTGCEPSFEKYAFSHCTAGTVTVE